MVKFNGKTRSISLTLCLSAVVTAVPVQSASSGSRGFHAIAGSSHHDTVVRHEFRRGYDHFSAPLVIVYSDDDASDQQDFSDSFLREKATYSPSRSAAKVLRVTPEQLQIGEARAARREARMLEQIDQLDIRFYRPNEAYDARFPSVVYLDSVRK